MLDGEIEVEDATTLNWFDDLSKCLVFFHAQDIWDLAASLLLFTTPQPMTSGSFC